MNLTNTMILAATGMLSFALSAFFGKIGIPELHKLHFGQTIREEGPRWHEKSRAHPPWAACCSSRRR